MTLLTKNSFLDEIRKQYVLTARMKGLSERQVVVDALTRVRGNITRAHNDLVALQRHALHGYLVARLFA